MSFIILLFNELLRLKLNLVSLGIIDFSDKWGWMFDNVLSHSSHVTGSRSNVPDNCTELITEITL